MPTPRPLITSLSRHFTLQTVFLATVFALACSVAVPWVLTAAIVKQSRWQKFENMHPLGGDLIVTFTGRTSPISSLYIFQTLEISEPELRSPEGYRRALMSDVLGFRNQLDPLGPAPNWGPLGAAWRGTLQNPEVHLGRQRAFGWPCHSMGYWCLDNWNTGTRTLSWGWRPGWYAQRFENPTYALPLLPIWPAFLLNAILYWLIAFGFIRLASEARRTVRRRRGYCPECAYDLRSLGISAGCPECGWGRG